MDSNGRARRGIALVAALVVVIGAFSIGIASGQTTGNTYTACLKSGTLTKVAIGTEPASPCVGGATAVSWNEQGRDGEDGQDGANGVSSVALSRGSTHELVGPNETFVFTPAGPVPAGFASVVGSATLRIDNPATGNPVAVDCRLMTSTLAQVQGGGGGIEQRLLVSARLLPGLSVGHNILEVIPIPASSPYVSVQCTVEGSVVFINTGQILVTAADQGVVGI
jgi:hypothetical protein